MGNIEQGILSQINCGLHTYAVAPCVIKP